MTTASMARNAAMMLHRFTEKHIPEPNSGCWLWTGALTRGGYGCMGVGRTSAVRAHRVAWTLFRGPIPPGASVLHRCDVPACVNPDHLFLGTQAENMTDMVRKGRHSAKLSERDVRAIRANYAAGALQSDLAAAFGVCQTTISTVVTRRHWKHVEEEDAR